MTAARAYEIACGLLAAHPELVERWDAPRADRIRPGVSEWLR